MSVRSVSSNYYGCVTDDGLRFICAGICRYGSATSLNQFPMVIFEKDG